MPEFKVFGDAARTAGLSLFVRISEVLVPFIMWPVLVILAVLFNWQWHGSMYVLAFLPIAAICLSVLVYILPPFGFNSTFIHGSITVWLYAVFLFLIVLVGWTHFTIFMAIAAIPIVCLTWSVRIAIEGKQGKGLEDIFHKAGIPGAHMKVKRHDYHEDTF